MKTGSNSGLVLQGHFLFPTPEKACTWSPNLYLVCDSYIGMDVQIPLKVCCFSPHNLPLPVTACHSVTACRCLPQPATALHARPFAPFCDVLTPWTLLFATRIYIILTACLT